MPRIILIDNLPLMRIALSQLYEREPGYEVIGQFTSPLDAQDLLESGSPDLVTTNLVGPQVSGPPRVAWIRSLCPQAKILVCCYTVPTFVPLQELLDAGADGYVSRTAEPAEYLECTREVMAGILTVDRGTATLLIEAQQKRAALGLKNREEKVLALVAVGLTNAQIADRLNLSVNTVRQLVSATISKMGMPNRSAAADYVRTEGIISLGSEHVRIWDRRPGSGSAPGSVSYVLPAESEDRPRPHHQ